MHSFALLALASSAFALPIVSTPVPVVRALHPISQRNYGDDSNSYGSNSYGSGGYSSNSDGSDGYDDNSLIDLKDPAKLLAGVGTDVVAPVKIDAANVGLKDVKGLNGIADNNKINVPRSSKREEGSLVKAVAPVGAAVAADTKVFAPVVAKVGNVNANDVKAGNYIASGNNVNARGTSNLPYVIATAQANANNIVSNIKSLLASYPTADALNGPLTELNGVVATAVQELEALKGLQVDVILGGTEAQVSLQQVAGIIEEVIGTVADILVEVEKQLGYDIPAVYGLIGATVQNLLNTVTSLVPSVVDTLRGILGSVVYTLSCVGININLPAAGM